MRKDTGSTHNAAIAIFQFRKKVPMAISVVEMQEPASSGMKWEEAVSMAAQSAMVLVRSDRSFFPKKDNGSFRSCSARAILRTPLST